MVRNTYLEGKTLNLLEQSVGVLNQIAVMLYDDGSDDRKLAKELKMVFVD